MNINDIKNGYTENTEEDNAEIIKLEKNMQSSVQPEYKKVTTEDMINSGQFKEESIDKEQQKLLDNFNNVTDINGPIQDSIQRRTEQLNDYFEEKRLQKELGELDDTEEAHSNINEESENEFDPDYEDDGDYIKEDANIEHNTIYNDEVKISEDIELKDDLNTTDKIVNNKEVLVEHVDFTKQSKNSTSNINNDYDKDLELLENDGISDNTNNDDVDTEAMNKLKELLTSRLAPIEEKLDITGFTIVNRPISLNNSLSKIKSTTVKPWALLNTGINILVSPLGGDEIEEMARNYDSKNPNAQKAIFKKMYEHIVSPKPDKFEVWLKVISFYDIKNLYMSMYNAIFSDLNFIPYNCTDPSCKNIFLTDNISIDSMCKFDNDEVKDKFYTILNSEPTLSESSLYVSAIEPISQNYAFAIKEPSIYSNAIETKITDLVFVNKYSSIINIIPYIDGIYSIERETSSLRPIAYKSFPDSVEKTIKSKIITYAKIIRESITSDQYTRLISLINKFENSRQNNITYMLPGTVCPKCGKVIEEIEYNAPDLLFTRHHLGLLRNI